MKKHGITLTLFAAFSTALSAVVYSLTAPAIQQQALQQQKALLDQVLPPTYYDNDLQQDCRVVTDPNLGNGEPYRVYLARQEGALVAAAIESTAPDGYSGAIQLLVGADFQGEVLGVRVLEHHETPGLGDKIELRLSDWITHFTGKKVKGLQDPAWAVKKEGGDFDQFTGATITPRAVINEVKRTVLYLQTHRDQLTQQPACGDSK